jgi:hypothetical protein
MDPNRPGRRCAPTGQPCFAIAPMIPSEFKFTVERIEKLSAPANGEVTFRDTEVKGLRLRLRSSGAATYEVRYRVGGGRAAPMRRHTIGSRQQISLATARRIAGEVLAKARAGHAPPVSGGLLQSKPRMKLVLGPKVSSTATSIISNQTALSRRTKSRHCYDASFLNSWVANATSRR